MKIGDPLPTKKKTCPICIDGDIEQIKELFYQALDFCSIDELRLFDWNITIAIRTSTKIFMIDLWEHQASLRPSADNINRIKEAIDQCRWKWIIRGKDGDSQHPHIKIYSRGQLQQTGHWIRSGAKDV